MALICCSLFISYDSYSQGIEKIKLPDASQFKIDKNIRTNILPAKPMMNYSKSEKMNFASNLKLKKNAPAWKFAGLTTRPNFNFNFDEVKGIKNVLPLLPEERRFVGKRNLILPRINAKFKEW